MFEARTVTSHARFSRETGRRVGSTLVDSLNQMPQATWLFCAAKDGLEDLIAGIRDVTGTQALIGCTTDGEISNEGFHSGSVVLGGVVTNKIQFHVTSVDHLGHDSEEAGRELARKLPDSVRYVQLFSDGLTGNGCAILRGMRSILGDDVPVCGGAAADGERFHRTWQFSGSRILTDAAVAIGFCGDFQVSTGVRSGWSPIGIAKRVTRASGHVLYELDGRPALEVYGQFPGKHADRLPAVGVEYPLGIMEESDNLQDTDYNMLLRASMSVDKSSSSSWKS